MKISVHLCGSAYAYEGDGGNFKKVVPLFPTGRPQGSLINQQKRAIANAVEWIRIQGSPKPLIFVCTSPGFTKAANENGAIKAFTANLRNGYNCRHYVWVRELTKMGYPHFHFVAAIPRRVDFVSISRYWSGLFGRSDVNSIRFGTDPEKGNRQYYVKGQAMSWYLCKYLGKGLGRQVSFLAEAGYPSTQYKKTVRSFGISQEARSLSLPTIYETNFHFQETEVLVCSLCGLVHCRCVGDYPKHKKPTTVIGKTYEDSAGGYLNPREYEWRQHPQHKVWFGTKKTLKRQIEIYANNQRVRSENETGFSGIGDSATGRIQPVYHPIEAGYTTTGNLASSPEEDQSIIRW